MISGRLDGMNPQTRVWGDVRNAMAAYDHDLEAWLVKQNIWARTDHTHTFSLAQWNALVAWNGDRYSWDTVVLALLWWAVSDRREPDPILDLGRTHLPS